MHRRFQRTPSEMDFGADINTEQAYGLCLLSVIIAAIGLGVMVVILL